MELTPDERGEVYDLLSESQGVSIRGIEQSMRSTERYETAFKGLQRRQRFLVKTDGANIDDAHHRSRSTM